MWAGLVSQRYFEHCEITDWPHALHGTWFLWNFIELFDFILVEFTLSYFIWLDFYIRSLTSWFYSHVLASGIKAPWHWQYFHGFCLNSIISIYKMPFEDIFHRIILISKRWTVQILSFSVYVYCRFHCVSFCVLCTWRSLCRCPASNSIEDPN